MEQAILDDIINRLLEVRGRPGKQVQLSESEIRQLCVVSKDIFLRQPNLLELEAPIKICGTFWLSDCGDSVNFHSKSTAFVSNLCLGFRFLMLDVAISRAMRADFSEEHIKIYCFFFKVFQLQITFILELIYCVDNSFLGVCLLMVLVTGVDF